LITDLSKAYELLGVKPGISSGELKAAHRDLAKVWHPDRFVHDPRLQEKAQEKLKEINEAYELLLSGKTPRAAPPPPPPRACRDGLPSSGL
jgi:curved DNA-binding protein CbpA